MMTPTSEPAEAAPPSLLRNVAHLFSSQLFTWVLAAAIAVAMPRFLGPEGLGELRLATSIWTITQLFIGLGTSTYLTLEIARDRARGTEIIGTIIVLRVLAFFSTSLVLAVVVVVTHAGTDTIVVLVLIGVSVLIGTIAEVGGAALMGREQMKYPALASILSKLVYSAVVLGVLIGGGGVRAVAATGMIGSAISFIILWSSFRKFGRVSFGLDLAQARRIVRGSMAFFVFGAILVVYQQIDTVVISTLVDREVLGWYSTADTLFGTLLFVPTILLTAVLPRFSRLHVEDPLALDRLVQQCFSLLLLMGVPIGLGTMVIADRFALFLYGSDFRETGPVLTVFGVVIVLTFGSMLLGCVATVTGRQKFWNILMIAAIVASIPLDLVLIPWTDERWGNGAIGGALEYVVTESALLVLGIWRVVPTLVTRASLVRIAKILVAGGAMVGATWPLRDSFPGIPVAVGAIVYVGAVAVLRVLTDDEKTLVRRGLSRFG
jgi:O-antigen/teichoic acid export membrane protein